MNNIIVNILNKYWNINLRKFYSSRPDNNWVYNDILEYIGTSIECDRRRWMIGMFQECRCCNRHQNKRPTLLQYNSMFSGHYDEFGEDEDGETDYEYSSDEDERDICRCVCRHANRTLCEVNNLMCSVINDYE